MRIERHISLLIVALFGLFFLGRGITGYVIAKDCCLPPYCAPEDRCPSSQVTTFDTLQPTISISLGIFMLLTVLCVYLLVMHGHQSQDTL
ncbi:hypothetical protein HYW21_01525 [Candidatus Woesearchaeota archaeon]|nr:hypothetical protein [Candidatus Woesearchaeota archaeon]